MIGIVSKRFAGGEVRKWSTNNTKISGLELMTASGKVSLADKNTFIVLYLGVNSAVDPLQCLM